MINSSNKKINPNKVHYNMTCGCCNLPRSELKKVNNKYRCFCNHPGELKNRSIQCKTCNKIIFFGTTGAIPTYCDECSEKYCEVSREKKQKQVEARKNPALLSYRDYYNQGKDSAIISANRWDCKHRLECLNKHHDKHYLPCKGCKKYISRSKFF